MKLILAGALLAPMALFAQDKKSQQAGVPYKIEGTYKNSTAPNTFYIRYRANGSVVIDSAVSDMNGKFSFQGTVVEPTMATFQVWKDQEEANNIPFEKGYRGYQQFVIDKGTTSITVTNLHIKPTIEGTAAQTQLLNINKLTAAVDQQIENLSSEYMKAREAKDQNAMDSLEGQYEHLDSVKTGIYRAYLRKNPKTPIGIYVISEAVGYDIDPAIAEPLYENLAAQVKESPSGIAFAKRLDVAKKTAIGQPAIPFSQNDKDDEPISLESFKGKYVLVDFWASWCGPCRQENPNVVKAFEKYKDQGFTIFGVSLDKSKEKWLQAIEKDNLHWAQVSDLKGWGNEVAALYGVTAIPQNFLIDPNGVIIGKNLRGEALEKKLAEIFE
ncbi:peroxiredoxin [Chitinophaga skermanii]|uniref:Peroxiredoxin n=2 Tax=Chitinophaga skermanii TaxID=331697 RepID=A0A327QFW2_9BACT|nr:peroxiredoxin [Chitinophaga skermanii]